MNSTNYIENLILNTFFTSGTTYLGLSTTVPNLDGTNFTEPTGSYLRKSITWSSPNHVGYSGYIVNNNEVQFDAPTYNWGSLQYCGIFDNSIGGNLLQIGAITGNVQIDDIVKFPSGSLNLSIN